MESCRPAVSARSAVLALALAAGLAGCGSSPSPAPSPSAVPLRGIETCAADVVVPAETLRVTPAAGAPPTAVLATGESVTFPVTRGARVGLLGDADPVEDAGLCGAASPDGAGSLAVVATAAGFARIGLQVGVATPTEVLVKVTG